MDSKAVNSQEWLARFVAHGYGYSCNLAHKLNSGYGYVHSDLAPVGQRVLSLPLRCKPNGLHMLPRHNAINSTGVHHEGTLPISGMIARISDGD